MNSHEFISLEHYTTQITPQLTLHILSAQFILTIYNRQPILLEDRMQIKCFEMSL